MTQELTIEEWSELLRTFDRTAFRLEQQLTYAVDVETGTVGRFLEGDPQDPTEIPHLDSWFRQIANQTAAGRKISRVRIVEDPMTGYQRWEQWLGDWNIRAGEQLRYISRSNAEAAGLLPAAGSDDWWLLDDEQLVVMQFDETGTLSRTELVTDRQRVEHACDMRDLAVRHSTSSAASSSAV